MSTPAVERVAERCEQVLDQVERAVVGKREALELILIGLLADGHVLIEDYPGLAKTLVARSFAQVLDMEFGRIQFTPDLMPSDVTGSSVFPRRQRRVRVPAGAGLHQPAAGRRDQPGAAEDPVGAARGDGRAAGDDRRPDAAAAAPFLVIATQNPIEYEGTYPLPEAQLDRFLLRLSVGYPSRDDEWEVLDRRMIRQTDRFELERVSDAAEVLAMQAAIEHVHVSPAIGLYMVDLAAATRTHPQVEVGASPRGTLALLELFPLPGHPARPGLRDARGREAGRRARARPPDDAAPRAVGAANHAGDGRGRLPRPRPGPPTSDEP